MKSNGHKHDVICRTLIKAQVEFKVNDRPVSFAVIHNMPNVFGVSFDCALDCWLARTKHYTAKSLVKYINSKNTESVAMTESDYERISKYGS